MSYEYPPIGGGGAKVVQHLAATLASRGHEIDVVTSGMTGLASEQRVGNVTVYRVRCVRRHRHYTTTPELATYLWPAYRKALALASTRAYDLNHTHFALPTGLISYLVLRKTRLPYVITSHGSDVPGYNPDRFQMAHCFAGPLWRRILVSSAAVTSPSHFLKRLIQKSVDVPIWIAPNGFQPTLDTALQDRKRNRVLVVTRMFPRKGVQHLIEALAGMKVDWDITVAGDGPYLPELRRQAVSAGVKVNFLGHVQGPALRKLYASSRIFVFPSIRENFPLVLLEAMEAGCAIITTNAEGCAEVVGEGGITVAPDRPSEIRAALVKLLRDPAEVARLGALAAARVRRFAWPEIALLYERVFEHVLVNSQDLDSQEQRSPLASYQAGRAVSSRWQQ